jgi:hypothetical protein
MTKSQSAISLIKNLKSHELYNHKNTRWPEYAIIITDTNGNNLVFETQEEAEKEAEDCQDGLIVEL